MESTLEIEKGEIDRFSFLLGYNMLVFLDLYRIFVENNLPNILDFYMDQDSKLDQYSFKFLNELTREVIIVDNLIKTNKSLMINMSDWEIVDFFEDVKIKIETFNNMQKWTRSSKNIISWGQSSIQTDYVIAEYDTLETISSDSDNSKNEQNDWQKIALDNNLTEIEYTTKGGNKIKLNKTISDNPLFFLNSVIDTLSGEKLYGLDVNLKFNFVDDDLEVLGYKETALQSFKILLTLKKGDIPEFKNLGINTNIGNNVATLFYVSMTKQLTSTFDTDDSLRNFSIKDFFYKGGDVYIKASVDTLYNLTISDKIVKL